jgi:hypothetical protein
MRILFEMYHPGFLRNFEGPVRKLADRGHELILAFERPARLGEEALVAELCAKYPNIVTRELGKEPKTAWRQVAHAVRSTGDYLRYIDPRYSESSALRERAAKRAPAWAQRLGKFRYLQTPAGLARAMAMFRAAEAALPLPAEIAALVDEVQPDLVLVTPLVGLGSSQVDVIKAARQRRIPSVLGVASWDNLTNKGVIRAFPDRIIVWNEAQRDEAETLHHVPRSKVTFCGAWSYDHWFSWRAGCEREKFVHSIGLDPEHRYLLYVCSSPFIAPQETGFVRRWLAALRASQDAVLRKIGVLVRPHPQNAEQWREEDLAEWPNVAVWPRTGANPINQRAREDYFHSLKFSAGIVGINTSALIEAAIVSRPVFTIKDSEFAATQDGTLHFHHLTSLNGGLLHVASDWDEHLAQITSALAKPDDMARKSHAFVESFVRPFGPETAGVDRFVAAIEQMQGQISAPTSSLGASMMRPLLVAWRWRVARSAMALRRRKRTSEQSSEGLA